MGDEANLFQPIFGFSPVRRRECSQQNRSPVASQAPWTTSRCNRLLRPISSRIATLRKENEGRKGRIQKIAATEGSKCEHGQQTYVRLCTEKHPKDDDDPDWAPDYGPRKKLKRTYSSRGNHRGFGCARGSGNSTQCRGEPERAIIQLPPNIATRKEGGDGPVATASWYDSNRFCDTELLAGSADPDRFATLGRSKQFAGSQGRNPLRKLAQTVSPENWILINGLYNGLDALLRATSSTKLPQSPGSRSLFATCIRKIPQYLNHEQQATIERNDWEDVEDVVLSVYTELESLSQSENGGWKPLRELVRSHGVSLLREAILDFTIPITVARGLVILCEHAGAIDEAQELVAAMLLRSARLSKPRRASDLLFDRCLNLPVFTLKTFAARNLRYGFLYHQLAVSIAQDDIPIQWVSSPDMAVIWNMAIMHMAENGAHAFDAGELFRVVVSKSIGFDQNIMDRALRLKRQKAAGRPRKRKRMPFSNSERSGSSQAVKSTLLNAEDGALPMDNKEAEVTTSVTNLLTVLLTVHRIHHSSNGTTLPPRSSIQVLFQELEIIIISMHELSLLGISHNHGQSAIALPRAALGLFAMTVLRQHHQDGQSIQDSRSWSLLRIMMQDAKIHESISSVLCGMILCHAKVEPESSLTYFENVQLSLLSQSASTFDDENSRYLLRKVIVDAAFEFADETKNQRHLDWALELEETIHNDDCTTAPQGEIRTPLRLKTRNATGYRWEEGIGEWIARTPAAKFLHVQVPRAVDRMSNVAEPTEPGEVEEVTAQLSWNLLGSSPLPRPSFCYVRIETDRGDRASSHDCTSSRTRQNSIDSTNGPPCAVKRARRTSNIGRAALMSETAASTSGDEADELSNAGSSQESVGTSTRTATQRSRPILREISNLTRCYPASQSREKGTLPVRRRALTQAGIRARAARLRFSMRSSGRVGDAQSDDELGF